MTILPRIEEQLRNAAERRSKRALLPAFPDWMRGWGRRGALAWVAAAVVAVLLGFALAGGESDRQFDVAAAVYRALAPASGVRYVVTEQESGVGRFHEHNYVQRWSTFDPPRERVIWREQRSFGRERSWLGESAVKVGGPSWSWGSNQPGVMLRMKGTAILNDELDSIRAAYRSGRLRLVEKTTLEGREVYRLQARLPRMRADEGPDELLVDADTLVPVEAIDYNRDPHGRLRPIFVLRYRTFEELPATPANLAKLNMAPHPGVRIVERR